MELSVCSTDADYERWRAVRIAVVPHERCSSIAEMRAQDSPTRLLVLAREGGTVVGSGLADLSGSRGDTPLEVTPERWATTWLGDPMLRAVHEGEVVGCAGLHQDADEPGRAENGLTAVRRDWRRRGIARHLKLRRLNEQLGYATTRTSTSVARALPLR